MIKRETKYIIRRILIGVGIALIMSYLGACQVKAETLNIESSNTRLRTYDYSNNILATLSPTNNYDNGAAWNLSGSTAPTIRLISGGDFTINNAKLAIFNVKINNNNQNVTNNLGINTIEFANETCYFTTSYPTIIQQGGTNPSETQPSIYASAICPLNSSKSFTTNGEIIEIAKTGVAVSTVFVSDITIVTDADTTALLNYLQTLNSNIVDVRTWTANCYNRLVDLINVEQTNKDAIITAMRTLLESQNSLIQNQTTSITNAQNQTTTAVNGMNDTLKDSNVDSPNDSITQMQQNLPTNSVISDLLTLPIRMFQNIVNAVNGTCSPFSLGALFGTNLTLPCINIQNYLGSALWTAIDVIFCGIFVLSMRKKFVEIFENITSLKNGGNELE